MTTWEPTVEKAKLEIERFANSTHHLHDRVKNIHFPQRVIPGSVRTHDYDPFSILVFYKIHYTLILQQGAVVVMLVRKLDLQPHLHTVYITIVQSIYARKGVT
jgi:hypothetical protein